VPILLEQLLLRLSVLAGGLAALGLRRGGHNFLVKLGNAILSAPTELSKAVDHILHGAQAGAAEDALAQQYEIGRWFEALGALASYAAFTISGAALTTFNGFFVLVRSTIPTLVESHVRPVRVRLANTRSFADHIGRDRAIGDAAIRREVDVVKGGLASALADVAALPRVIDRKIGALHIPRLWHRLSKLEKLLAGAALGALVLRGLRRESCAWSCSPTGRRFGKWLHRFPRALLHALLEGAIDVLVLKELCLIVNGMTHAARAAAPVFDHLASMTSEIIGCTRSSRPPRLAVAWNDPPPLHDPISLG
jgi:hypothetical protein